MKSNLVFRTVSLVAISMVLGTSSGGAAQSKPGTISRAYPCLVEGKKNPDCELILRAATIAFQSKEPLVFEAGDDVRRKDRSLILWPTTENQLDRDPAFFDCREADNGAKVCIQKKASRNGSLVVKKKEASWQGDWHDVLLFKTNQNAQEIVDTVKDAEYGSKEQVPADIQVVSSGEWQRPWIFRNAANDHYLVVDTQHPADFMADWTIYGPDKNGSIISIGKVRFRPPGKEGIAVIPNGPLRELADVLDKIIGIPKESEGTYNATARVRLTATKAWGNLMFRPWAMETPYNKRAAVDKGLKQWAKGSSTYRRQYLKVQELYPKALQQLALYYGRSRNKTHTEAAELAKTALDKAFCAHFVFPASASN